MTEGNHEYSFFFRIVIYQSGVSRNTPSTTNLEEEEIVDAPGNDGNASMPEQVKRPNPWRKVMMMMIMNISIGPVRAMQRPV